MKKTMLSPSILVLILGAILLSSGGEVLAQDLTFRVNARDFKIAARQTSPEFSAVLQVWLDPAAPSQGTWVPPGPENEIAVISLRLSPTAPRRLLDQLDECLKMAQMLQVRSGLFWMKLLVDGFGDGDVIWRQNNHVVITIPDSTGGLNCDLRK